MAFTKSGHALVDSQLSIINWVIEKSCLFVNYSLDLSPAIPKQWLYNPANLTPLSITSQSGQKKCDFFFAQGPTPLSQRALWVGLHP
jgi:hypothetical protein